MASSRRWRATDPAGGGHGSALVLDAGALIGIERRSPFVQELITQARARLLGLVVPTVVVAQVVRGARQANLRRFLSDPALTFVGMDYGLALEVGSLLGRSGSSDIADACVVVCARRRGGAPIITSDPDDLSALDPTVPLIAV